MTPQAPAVAAAILSDVAGREVRHLSLGEAALAERFVANGLPPHYAATLAGLDASIRAGAEDRTTDAVVRFTGRTPLSFRRFAEASAETWRPD